MARTTDEELQEVSKFIDSFGVKPNIVTDVYKNRRGRWTNIRIWSYYDYGTCRKTDLFITSASMRERIDDFTIMEFKNVEEQNFSSLLEDFNGREKIEEKEEEKTYYMPEDNDTRDIVSNIKEAFGGREDLQQFYESQNWGDMI